MDSPERLPFGNLENWWTSLAFVVGLPSVWPLMDGGSILAFAFAATDMESWPLHWAVAAAVLLVVLGCSGAVWYKARRRRAEEGEWEDPDQLTALFTLLGRKLDERSFGFLVHRLDRHARLLRKLVESRSRKLAAGQDEISTSFKKDLSRLCGELEKLHQSVASTEETFRGRSEDGGDWTRRATEKLAELEGSIADLSERFERLRGATAMAPEQIAGELDRSNAVSLRTANEIEQLREVWECHVEAMQRDLGHIAGLMERLVSDGGDRRDAEGRLHDVLEQALAREQVLKEVIEEERSGVRQEMGRLGETIERQGQAVSALENSCQELLGREGVRERELERLRSENGSLRTEIEKAQRGAEREMQSLAREVEALQAKLQEAAARLRDAREELELERTTSSELRERTTALFRKIKGLYSFHRAIAEGALPIPTIAVDENFKVFVWNPAAEKFFHLPRSEVLGHRLPDVDIGSADLAQALLETMEGAMNSRLPTMRPECGYLLRDREEVWPRLSCEPILNEKQRVVGAVLGIESTSNGVSRSEAPRDTVVARSDGT